MPHWRKDLDTAIALVGHVHVTRAVHGDIARLLEPPLLATPAAPLGDEFSVGSEHLDALVPVVGHVYVAGPGHGNSCPVAEYLLVRPGEVELAIQAATAASLG